MARWRRFGGAFFNESAPNLFAGHDLQARLIGKLIVSRPDYANKQV